MDGWVVFKRCVVVWAVEVASVVVFPCGVATGGVAALVGGVLVLGVGAVVVWVFVAVVVAVIVCGVVFGA